MVRSGAIDILVIDSVAALVPKAEIDGEMGDSHVGLQARLMSQALRKLTAVIAKSNCILIFINQLREKVGVMFGSPETTTGGRALKFYASVRLDIRRVETLKQLCLAGMNVARLNFSHGTHAEHKKKIDLIKKVRQELDLPIGIMLDTKGPEYRIRTFKTGKIQVKEGDSFTFTTDEVEGDETRVSVNYRGLVSDLNVGILLAKDANA